MALLSAQDEQVLKQHLSAIDKPVSLLLFTQTIAGSESGLVAKQVLDELAQLHDKITVVERTSSSMWTIAHSYGVDQSPAIVVLSEGADTRMRFFGAPTGYEFVPPGRGCVDGGHRQVDLEDATLKLLARSTSRCTCRCSRHRRDRTVPGRSSWRTRWRRNPNITASRSKPPSSWS